MEMKMLEMSAWQTSAIDISVWNQICAKKVVNLSVAFFLTSAQPCSLQEKYKVLHMTWDFSTH